MLTFFLVKEIQHFLTQSCFHLTMSHVTSYQKPAVVLSRGSMKIIFNYLFYELLSCWISRDHQLTLLISTLSLKKFRSKKLITITVNHKVLMRRVISILVRKNVHPINTLRIDLCASCLFFFQCVSPVIYE